MKKMIENVTITLVTTREFMLDSFTAKVERLSANEFLVTEKIVQKYPPLPRIFEGDTLSITMAKDGKVGVNIKKFKRDEATSFLSRLYEELKAGLEAVESLTDGETLNK